MFKAAGIPDDDAAYSIARRIGQTITPEQAEILSRRIDQVKKTFGKVKSLRGVYKKTESMEKEPNPESAVQLAGSILSVAGWFSKGFKWAAKDVNTLSLAVYASEYNAAKYEINKLTTMTEAQLKDLSEYTRRLRTDTVALRSAEKTLKSSPPCDSTNLAQP